ncbi:hypothetical protein TraAM80_03779 [Trypanosoma rangeli]|uniref:FAM13A-like domain-containing protein n=1 Tax=Trypanosoma rangeli TaxID=5698 RepID=A0A3R7MJB6_TRYRA|nr:uncharacterized protein TraAM80_03779 [Trypanosoma rangeli]RNF06949.1 hypothetical protein TraAM80_03779 [Trypanosoma rangeli]|eukprot:RNF06949.1 hypothetical protein TraAM80_03779 [Trypanosoma rangeli]
MAMDVSGLLFQTTAEIIDALSFMQTHVIDENFRAHSKTNVNSVRSLQREQRSRIEQNYGPRAASSDTIAAQLRAAYRGETTSLELTREANGRGASPAVITNMSPGKCQAFKREMKQRIHEWERAFLEDRGVAVTAHDKVSLRHVYELYKAAKNRLRETESPQTAAFGPSVEGSAEPLQPQHHDKQPQQLQQLQPSQPLHESGVRSGDANGEERGGSVGMQSSYAASSQLESGGGARFTAPASVRSSVNVSHQASPARNISKGKPASQMSDEELVTEKRYLKHILHLFESNFEKSNGRPSTKSDRHVWMAEYTRYGELKNEILRRSTNGNQGGSATAAVEPPAAATTASMPMSDKI